MPSRILVIEDDAHLRDTFRRFLSKDGYRVDTAGDYQAAVGLLGEHGYDAIFIGINLTGKKINAGFNKVIHGVSAEVLEVFMAYPWPGNVRELRHILEYAASHAPGAALAIKGWKLRASEKGPGYGILTNDAQLLSRPSAQARVVKELKAGQAVKIERAMITSPGEEGPRGGPAHYDQVELIPGREKGYISRAGDDFSPFM